VLGRSGFTGDLVSDMKRNEFVILSGAKDLAMTERDERIGCEVLRFAQNDKRRKW
jgi:hypothetical protein